MLIVGTGGHAMDSFDVWHQLGSKEETVFFNNIDPDFQFQSEFFKSFQIVRNHEEVKNYFSKHPEYILGIGNPYHREKLDLLMKSLGGTPYNLISSKATIGRINNRIGQSVSIMNGVIITIHANIGNGVLINTGANVTHDAVIEDYAEIGPGVNIAGACTIKHHAFIGTGAIILPKVTIGEHAVVAAGAVVTKDVAPYTMVAGNPAMFKKMISK